MSQPTDNQEPTLSDEPADAHLDVIDLDAIAKQPPARRKRLVQLALVVLILAVAETTLWRFPLSLLGVPLSPTPLPAMVKATLLSNINFGTMLVNGKALAGHPPLTTTLPSQGTTIITLNAPPFRPKRCVFTDMMSPLNDPNCLLVFNEAPPPTTRQASPSPGEFISGVFLTPDDLPPDQQSQAFAMMSQPLGAPQQSTVPVGEYVATSSSPDGILLISKRTAIPLLASVTFEPSKTPGPPVGPECGHGICPRVLGPTETPGLADQSWSLFFAEAERWRFSDTTGATLADVSIPSMNIVGIDLSYDSSNGWQLRHVNAISGSVQGTVCDAGIAVLWFKMIGNAVPLHDQGVEGCELGLSVNGVDQGRYVWRFGVLLAADALAHRVMPDLPIASPAELAAVGG